jgi:hypothetical protein
MSEGKQIHGAGFLARGARGFWALADLGAFLALVFVLVFADVFALVLAVFLLG